MPDQGGVLVKAQPSNPTLLSIPGPGLGGWRARERRLDLEPRLSSVLYWTGLPVSGNVTVLTAASELKSMGLSCHQ